MLQPGQSIAKKVIAAHWQDCGVIVADSFTFWAKPVTSGPLTLVVKGSFGARLHHSGKTAHLPTMKEDRRMKLKLEEHREIIRRRMAGEAAIVLANEFGVSKKTVDDLFQQSLTPGARISRRQLNHYLKLLGREPPNVQRIVDSKAVPKTSAKPLMRRKRLDEKTWRKIQSRHAGGEGVRELAAEFGVTRQAVVSGIKRIQNPRQPLVPMTMEQLGWLKERIMPAGRRRKRQWSQEEVRRLLTDRFGQRISLRTFRSHLEWMGVRSPKSNVIAARRQAMRDEKRRTHEVNERLVLASIKSGQLPLIVRGRPQGSRKKA